MGIGVLKRMRRRLRAGLLQFKYRSDLHTIRYFGLFIGYPRSGHTLVAALLDAHDHMTFANGLDAAQYLVHGFSAREVAVLMIWNSLRFTRHGRRSNGYDYTVPAGWHGGWNELQVVGDKSGDLLSDHLRRNPDLLSIVMAKLAARARFVHVVRNPYDCIASISSRGGIGLRAAADVFFELCDANAAARRQIPAGAIIDLRLEDLIAQPRATLNALCAFFDQECSESYFQGCARLIFQSARRSSLSVKWEPELAQDIARRLRAFHWFDGYRFEAPDHAD